MQHLTQSELTGKCSKGGAVTQDFAITYLREIKEKSLGIDLKKGIMMRIQLLTPPASSGFSWQGRVTVIKYIHRRLIKTSFFPIRCWARF